MADQKQPSQPQGGQSQGGQHQGGTPEVAKKAQEVLSRTQDYQKQLAERQSKYLEKYNAAWTTYYKKLDQAAKVYQETVSGIHEGARKAAAPQSSEGESAEKSIEAYKAARAKNLHSANEVHLQLRNAERKYAQVCTSFWDDVWDSVSDAVDDFWNWVVGWWEEPPVEGAAPTRYLADPAWRGAFDPTVTAYYSSGWNYGAKLG